MDEHGASDFVELLQWLVAEEAGGGGEVAVLARRSKVNVLTLRRWLRGDYPKRRNVPNVEKLDAWAHDNVRGYPPPDAGGQTLVQLGGAHTAPATPRAGTTGRSGGGSLGEGRGGDGHRVAPPALWRRRRVVVPAIVAVLIVIALAIVLPLTLHHGRGQKGVVELSDNRQGVVVFGDQHGAAVPHGVADRIPYGTSVEVECVAADESGIESVTALYKIASGPWKSLYAVSDSFTNGGNLGSTDGPNVDPRIRKC